MWTVTLTGTLLLDGHPTRLIRLQDEYKDEYEALTKEEREELIEEFTVQRDECAKIKRPTPRARIANVANVVRNMQLLVCCFIKSYRFR
jgi:DNA-directed RNA polymerase subunit H (RpoH/RPB5)